jgi:FAD/FMN-containing dehydrogenase
MAKVRNKRKLQKQLTDILSHDRVIVGNDISTKYRFDALRPYRPYPNLRKHGYLPTILVRPENTQEVAEIILLARRARVPIVPYGGGTGLMGAAIAVGGGIMIDACRMNRIEEISRENFLVRAQAGIVQEELYNQLDKDGLLFAHDPWTRPIATLGGAISTNSLGYLGAKYGSAGAQLLGIEAVMPDGRLLRTRPAQFSSTGFDLKRLFVGTEGMFGFLTSATMRAFPKPEHFTVAAYSFSNFEQGFRAISSMRAQGVNASMIDYGEENPGRGNEALLNVAFDGLRPEVDAQVARTLKIIRTFSGHSLDDKVAHEFWEHRHDIALMFSRRVSNAIPEEELRTKYDYIHLSLPPSKLLEFRDETLRLSKGTGVKVLEVGLWHGPELLSLVLSSRASNPRTATRNLWRTGNAIIRHAQDVGGCMEFCHGVGLKLAHLMEREHGLGLDVMRRLKRAVDPLGIMNPGKAAL